MILNRIAFIGLLFILLAITIPFGSNRLWALSIVEIAIFGIAIMSIAAWGMGWVVVHRPLRTLLFLFIAWGMWLLWIWLQTYPLELEYLNQLSPRRLQHIDALKSAGISVPSEYLTISVAVNETQNHFIESVAYVTLFFTVVLLTNGSRSRLKAVLWILVISGLLQTLYGSLMLLSGIEWGFWGAKEHYQGSATGTFVNRNHFAGYLQLCIASAIGLHMARKAIGFDETLREKCIRMIKEWDTQTVVIRSAIIFMFIGMILSQSRMGNAAILGGLGITGLIFLLARRGKSFQQMLLLFVSIIVLDVWIIGGWFGLEELVDRYQETELQTSHRANMWPDLMEMSDAYSVTGSGLGTFRFAYPEFRSEAVKGENRHAHNDYAEFMIETGLIGVTLLGLIVLATVFQAIRILFNRRNPVYIGVALATLIALCSVAIHSLTDFNLQIPANAATLVVLMALAWSCNPISSRGTR